MLWYSGPCYIPHCYRCRPATRVLAAKTRVLTGVLLLLISLPHVGRNAAKVSHKTSNDLPLGMLGTIMPCQSCVMLQGSVWRR